MELLKKSSYFKKETYRFEINFNIYFLLFLTNFIVYSLYAILSKYNILLVEILIYSNFIIFFTFYKKYSYEKISYSISLNRKEILILLLIFSLIFILIFSELNIPLFADELAPTLRSVRTSFFASLLIIKILDINLLKEIPLKFIIQFLNLSQIIFLLLIFKFYKSKDSLFYLILIISISLILRFSLQDGVHHPPLNHIFSSTFTTLFSLNHFTVRLSYLVPFFIYLVCIFSEIRKVLDFKTSVFFILSVGTFPFTLIAFVTPDHSIWSSLIFTYLLFYIFINKKIDYRFCVLIISLGILFRITIFSGFILIAVVFIKDFLNNKFELKVKLNDLFIKQKIYLPILLFLPLIIISAYTTEEIKLPAFDGLNNVNPFFYLIEAIRSKIIVYSLIKQIPAWYYIFIFFIFFTKNKTEIIIFFLFNLMIYFSIDRGLWGNAKYVLEYGVPFFIFGHFVFTKYIYNKKKYVLISIINIVIIFMNIIDIYKFPSNRLDLDKMLNQGSSLIANTKDKKTKYFLKPVYDYDQAYEYLKQKNKETNVLFLGTTYGYLPQTLENFSFKELNDTAILYKKYESLYFDKKFTELQNANKNDSNSFIENLKKKFKSLRSIIYLFSSEKKSVQIKNDDEVFSELYKLENLDYVLIANWSYKKRISNILLNNKWILLKKFTNKEYGSTLLLFKKE